MLGGRVVGADPKRCTVHELRAPGETGKQQADIVIHNYGKDHVKMLIDLSSLTPSGFNI